MPTGLGHPVAELAIQPTAAQVRVASIWMAEVCRASGVPAPDIYRLDLCLNEALANTLSHGGAASRQSQVHLGIRVHSEGDAGEATVTVTDAGLAFDTTGAALKPRPATLADAEPGGLGLLLMRRFSDRLDYRFADGWNQLSFTVRWTRAGA